MSRTPVHSRAHRSHLGVALPLLLALGCTHGVQAGRIAARVPVRVRSGAPDLQTSGPALAEAPLETRYSTARVPVRVATLSPEVADDPGYRLPPGMTRLLEPSDPLLPEVPAGEAKPPRSLEHPGGPRR